MNLTLFLALASFFGIIYVIFGIRASRKVASDLDYFVAGRKLGTMQITANLIATQLGGGMLLGTAAAAYTTGFYGLMYTLGMCIGFLLLAGGIASRLQQFNVTTTAQLFETQYGSIALKKIASLLSIITLFGILIAQVVGFKSLLIGVGLSSTLFAILFWLSVVAYTMIGGLRAITINDMIQLTIITIVFGSIFIYVLIMNPHSIIELSKNKMLFYQESQGFLAYSGIIIMPALFSLMTQDLAQRFFASRTQTVATQSALYAAIFLLIFAFIPVFFGMQARILGLEIAQGSNPLMVILQQYTNDFVFALILCAIIAAIISTADALMNAVTANITQDFNLAAALGIKNHLPLSKSITALVGIAALIGSYYVPQNIIDIIIESYELSVSCLLVPLLFCYFKKRVEKQAAIGAICAGLIGFVLLRIYPVPLKEVITLAMSLIGYGIGTLVKTNRSR